MNILYIINMFVKVYYNLRKKMFSVQHKGRVVDHVNSIMLLNAKFKVSEAGRQRVLKEKRKNVHAFVCGEAMNYSEPAPGESREVTYNPYKYNTFVYKDTLTPVEEAYAVWLDNKRIRVNTV